MAKKAMRMRGSTVRAPEIRPLSDDIFRTRKALRNKARKAAKKKPIMASVIESVVEDIADDKADQQMKERVQELERKIEELSKTHKPKVSSLLFEDGPVGPIIPSPDEIKSWLIEFLTPVQLEMAEVCHVSPETYAMEYLNCLREGKFYVGPVRQQCLCKCQCAK
jgi:polyhydroxyalkanoate synthesis regulator phasin